MSRKKARQIASENLVKPDAVQVDASVARTWAVWIWGLLIVVVTLGAYWPALQGKFVFDDDLWTTNAEKVLRDFSGLWRIWTDTTALQQYYPLTGTSFWIDYQLWHWWTLPYHVENVLLHATCALLLWRLLLKLEVPGAWLTGALFALHPVMVESTAWITERKNVLSMVFFLASLLTYGRYQSFWKGERMPRRRSWSYALALLLFLGALLSKITAFALPPVFLLLGWWKLGRIRWREDVLPTLPFFALSVGLSLLIAWLEKHHVGADGAGWDLSWPERFLIAGRVPWFYAGKLFWPVNLCLDYPRWKLNAGSGLSWLFPLGAVAALLVPWLYRKRLGRGPVLALFCFAGTLFPVLGFMNVYGMLYSFVADRWVYLSSPALLALGVAFVAQLEARMARPVLLRGLALLVLPILAVLTWQQAGQYKDSETLWRATVTTNPESWLAHGNLGYTLDKNGLVDEAKTHYQTALELNPNYADAHNNLGKVIFHEGKWNEAIDHFQKALELNPNFIGAHNNLASALLRNDQADKAVAHYQHALLLNPDYAEAHYNLGNALLQLKQVDEAISHYHRALELRPEYFESHYNLGNAFLQKDQVDVAINHFKKALELKPDYPEAQNNLGNALLHNGQMDEALVHYRKAIQLNPEMAEAQNNYGELLLRNGQVDEAIEHYQKALELKPDYAEAHYNMGNALLQKGRVDEAISHYREALELEPEYTLAHLNLGNALKQAGRMGEAISQYEAALKLSPSELGALNNLAWMLATSPDAAQRNGARALEVALQANQLSGGNHAIVQHTLAAAYAECGRFAEAAEVAERAMAGAISEGNTAMAAALRNERELYLAGKALREALPAVMPSR
ncbi:MAG: tetratricopeptide repeat protein [Verrucomicrobia bacterium]|nr:tetratricopeptide repeat protein [Verrucomicrobiota bacterium]